MRRRVAAEAEQRRLSLIVFILWLIALQLAALLGTYLLARLWL